MELDKDLKSRQEVRGLVIAAKKASEILATWTQTQIDNLVKSMADAAYAHAEELAKLAYEETGFGNIPHKIRKNQFASRTVWEAISHQKTVGILVENDQTKIWDVAVPVGVVAAIVPSTNPSSTTIYKALICLKGGNAVVFSPHPGAKKCTQRAVDILVAAAKKAGCPDGAISALPTPSMAGVEELMHHEDVRLILATGGGAMVRAAYSSGKPAIGVGAGNGPAYIHSSCNLPKAIEDIVTSKTFDNGVICASEQSIITEASMADAVKREMEKQGCFFLSVEQAKTLATHLFKPNGMMSPVIVGKTAIQIANLAGLTVPAQTKILVAHETGVGAKHPYSHEKLCPILAFFVERDEQAVLAKSCEILYNEGRGHTFVIHANDDAVIRRFALKIPVSRFLVNTPAALGGIGETTNLFPALTLGCGAVGGSSSSNNIGTMDVINIRRVAWGVSKTQSKSSVIDDTLLDQLVARILQNLN